MRERVRYWWQMAVDVTILLLGAAVIVFAIVILVRYG